jgi:hypothetical protein
MTKARELGPQLDIMDIPASDAVNEMMLKVPPCSPPRP